MRSKLMLIALAAALALSRYAIVRATPSTGFTATTLAKTTFDAFHLDAKTIPANIWHAELKTKGRSDLYVQSNVWAAGGTTGWHTHPGPSFVMVTAGTVTVYEGDDDSCAPHAYTPGMGFIDPGGGHVHVIRNEGSIEARTVAVQLIPEAAVRRIDVAAPGNCAF